MTFGLKTQSKLARCSCKLKTVLGKAIGGSVVASLAIFAMADSASAQSEQVVKALKIKPTHPDVTYDIPSAEQLKECTIKAVQEKGRSGYVVYDGSGRTLRMLLDTNADNKLDQWSFFKDGMEVYRDVDTNKNRKADQYRWIGAAGTRWGIDKNDTDDSVEIDYWKMISAEEVAREIFEAVRTGDSKRFNRVLVSNEDLRTLNLGDEFEKEVAQATRNSAAKFAAAARAIRGVSRNSKWEYFGTSQPALVPMGTGGLEADIVVYDYASTAFTTGEKFGQLALGTLIKVGDSWKAIELPILLSTEKEVASNGGVFMKMPEAMDVPSSVALTPGMKQVAELWDEITGLEGKVKASRSAVEISRLESEIAKKYVQLVDLTKGDDRTNWIQQMADTVSDAYLKERYTGGLDFLKSFVSREKKANRSSGADYVAYKVLQTEFSEKVETLDRRGGQKAMIEHMENLDQFVKEYPKSPIAADALMRLALDAEFQDDFDLAKKRYSKIVDDFGSSPEVARAKGSVIRLSSVGRSMAFKGTTLRSQGFDLANRALRGKIVVLHFWDSTTEFSTDQLEDLARINKKWSSEIVLVGCNVDLKTETCKAYLAKNRNVNWTQLHAPGGVEQSPLATQVGLPTVPTIMLFDSKGHLVEGNLSVTELDREIQNVYDDAQRSQRAQNASRNRK